MVFFSQPKQVRETLGLSFHNIGGLLKLVDKIPDRAGQWTTRTLKFKDRQEEPYLMRHRDVIDAIKSLWGDPALSEHLVYKPKKIFSDSNKSNRIYSEMWTGKWWSAIQVSFNLSILLKHFN